MVMAWLLDTNAWIQHLFSRVTVLSVEDWTKG